MDMSGGGVVVISAAEISVFWDVPMSEGSPVPPSSNEDKHCVVCGSHFAISIKGENSDSQAVNVHSVIRLNTRIKASSGDAGKRWWPPGVG